MASSALNFLRQLNRIIAILVGVGLLACAAFILIDIILRQTGEGLGGTDEISGYAMAIATSWGMAYCLLELGHVRIDLIRTRLAQKGRVMMDLFSLTVLAGVAVLIATRCWPVLERSMRLDSAANTPLATPLALVQGPWFAGWVWFAFIACATLLCTLAMVAQGKWSETEAAIGVYGEAEQAADTAEAAT